MIKKRLLSIFLSLALIISVGMPAFTSPIVQAEEASEDPTVYFELPDTEDTMTPAAKEALLNAAELNEIRTGWEPLDTFVDEIFSEILDDNMSTYQKTCAIFAYLMDGTTYVTGNQTTEAAYRTVGRTYESMWDRNIVCEAYGMMMEKHGVCNDFAAAFTVLSRAIGLESYYITCASFVPGLGAGDHFTSAVRLNGKLYMFDPVMGVALGNTTEVETSKYFCMPLQSGLTREYCDFDEQITSFCNFRKGNSHPVQTETIDTGIDREVYYSFGSYPQTLVTDETLISALNAELDESNMQSYGYYSGNGEIGSQQQSAYMRFADVTYGTEKYRAVRFSSFRPPFTYLPSDNKTAMQAAAGYKPNTIYWFRFEPIEWRLISSDNMLVSNIVLDSQAFNANVYSGDPVTGADGMTRYVFGDANCTQPANKWETSDIRAWLNGTFMQTAFTSEEQSLIAQTQLKNIGAHDIYCYPDTDDDRVFLLSRNDLLTASNYVYANSLEARMTTGSDYALSQGVAVRKPDNAVPWLLRSAGTHSSDITIVTNKGYLHCNLNAAGTIAGIRPAIRVTDLEALIPETVMPPRMLRATPTATGEISLRSAVSNDADGYIFMRFREGSTVPEETIRSTSPRIVMQNLFPGTKYTFRVKAYRLKGEQTETSGEVVSPEVLCRTFVTAPETLSANATASGVITVQWDPVQDAVGYRVYRYLDPETMTLCGESDTTSFSIPSLGDGYTYWFKVSSVSADGYESEVSTTVSCKSASIPGRPVNVNAAATATGALTVTWNAVPGAGSYKVWRYTSSTERTLVGETEGCSFTETGRFVGYASYYCVTALTPDGKNESIVSTTAQGMCESIPAKPVNVNVAATATGALTVTWDAVPGAGSYKVWRYTSATEKTLVGETSACSFTETGRAVGSSATYCVTALTPDQSSESVVSTAMQGTSESIPAKPTNLTSSPHTSHSQLLSWDAVPGAALYRISIHRNGAYSEIGTTAENHYVVSELNTGTEYYFRVIAETEDHASQSVPADLKSTTESVPAKPVNVNVTATATGALTIRWDAVPGAGSYKVWRYTSSTDKTLVGETTQCSFTETGRPVGYTASYCVTALTPENDSESAVSATAQGMCESVPAKPVNVKVTATATGALTISWDAVPGAGSYKVWRYISANEKTLVGETSDCSITETGRTVGSSATYCVTALTPDQSGESVVSAAVQGTSESIPAKPTNLTSSPHTSHSQLLSWDAMPGAALYRISIHKNGAYSEIGTTAENHYVVSELNTGTEYYFRVIAETEDHASQSLPADLKSATESVPAKPVNVSVTATATGALTISWDAVPGAGSYKVWRYTSSTEKTLVGETAGCSLTETGRPVGYPSSYCVTALTPEKDSESGVSATAQGMCESIPARPEILSSGSAGAGTIRLTWNAVPGAASYNIYRYISSTETSLVGTVTGTSFTETGRYEGSTYSYLLSALTADGGSESLKSPVFKALCPVTPAAPKNLTASVKGPEAVSLSWSASANAGSYNVYFRVGDSEDFALLGNTQDLSYTADDLQPLTLYGFRVVPVAEIDGAVVEGHASTVVSVQTPDPAPAMPETPTGLTAAATGDGEITLSWNPAAGASKYNVYMCREGNAAYTLAGASDTAAYTAKGLNNGTVYSFKVYPVAENAAGTQTGDPTAAVSAKALGTPAAPTGVSAAATGDGQITLTWNAVAGATQYNVYRYRGDVKNYVYVGTSYSTSYAVSGLSNGTAYYFKVMAATKGNGLTFAGPYSVSVSAKALGTPAAPTGLTAAAAGNGRITLTWTKSAGATQYNVYRYRGDVKNYVYVGTSYANSYTVSGLSSGVTYYFRVCPVVKENGFTFVGNYSAAVNAKA